MFISADNDTQAGHANVVIKLARDKGTMRKVGLEVEGPSKQKYDAAFGQPVSGTTATATGAPIATVAPLDLWSDAVLGQSAQGLVNPSACGQIQLNQSLHASNRPVGSFMRESSAPQAGYGV